MSDEIDRICQELEAPDEKAAQLQEEERQEMSRVIIFNVVPDVELDFNCVSQTITDPVGMLQGNLAAILIEADADAGMVASALEEIAQGIREYGIEKLYHAADIPGG